MANKINDYFYNQLTENKTESGVPFFNGTREDFDKMLNENPKAIYIASVNAKTQDGLKIFNGSEDDFYNVIGINKKDYTDLALDPNSVANITDSISNIKPNVTLGSQTSTATPQVKLQRNSVSGYNWETQRSPSVIQQSVEQIVSKGNPQVEAQQIWENIGTSDAYSIENIRSSVDDATWNALVNLATKEKAEHEKKVETEALANMPKWVSMTRNTGHQDVILQKAKYQNPYEKEQYVAELQKLHSDRYVPEVTKDVENMKKRIEDLGYRQEVETNVYGNTPEFYLVDKQGLRVSNKNARYYADARRLIKDTEEILNAPYRNDSSSGIVNFGKGAAERLTDEEFWMPILTIAKNMNIGEVAKKMNNGEELTPEESILLESYINYGLAQQARQYDLSKGYMAGQGTAESVKFMLEMAIGGAIAKGTGKLLTSAGNKFASKFANKTIGRTVGKATNALTKLATNENKVAKAGKAVTEALIDPMFMASNYSNITQQYADEHVYGDGDFSFVDATSAYLDTSKEILTEKAGEGLSFIGAKGLNYIKGKKFGKWIDSPMMKQVRNLYKRNSKMNLFIGALQNPISEVGEEYIGGVMDFVRSYNPLLDDDRQKELRDNAASMFTKEGLGDTALMVAPLSFIFGGVSFVSGAKATRNYSDAKQKLTKELFNQGLDESQVASIITKLDSTDDIKERKVLFGKLSDAIIQQWGQRNPTATTEEKQIYAQRVQSTLEYYALSSQAFNDMIAKITDNYNDLKEDERKSVDKAFEAFTEEFFKRKQAEAQARVAERQATEVAEEQFAEQLFEETVQEAENKVPDEDAPRIEVYDEKKGLFVTKEGDSVSVTSNDGQILKFSNKSDALQIAKKLNENYEGEIEFEVQTERSGVVPKFIVVSKPKGEIATQEEVVNNEIGNETKQQVADTKVEDNKTEGAKEDKAEEIAEKMFQEAIAKTNEATGTEDVVEVKQPTIVYFKGKAHEVLSEMTEDGSIIVQDNLVRLKEVGTNKTRAVRPENVYADSNYKDPAKIYPPKANAEQARKVKPKDYQNADVDANDVADAFLREYGIEDTIEALQEMYSEAFEKTQSAKGLAKADAKKELRRLGEIANAVSEKTNMAIDLQNNTAEEVVEEVEAVEEPIAEVQPVGTEKVIEEIESILPIGVGPFGEIYDQFKGKAKEAISFLLKKKSGEAIGALSHKKIGPIDLVWGKEGSGKSDGFGLAKLVKFHPEVLENLQDILDDMDVVSETKNRINLESNTHKAAVRLTWDNERKTWLLTAFEKKETPVSTISRTDVESNQNDLLDDTTTQQNTSISEDKDTTNSSDTQGKQKEKSKPKRKLSQRKVDLDGFITATSVDRKPLNEKIEEVLFDKSDELEGIEQEQFNEIADRISNETTFEEAYEILVELENKLAEFGKSFSVKEKNVFKKYIYDPCVNSGMEEKQVNDVVNKQVSAKENIQNDTEDVVEDKIIPTQEEIEDLPIESFDTYIKFKHQYSKMGIERRRYAINKINDNYWVAIDSNGQRHLVDVEELKDDDIFAKENQGSIVYMKSEDGNVDLSKPYLAMSEGSTEAHLSVQILPLFKKTDGESLKRSVSGTKLFNVSNSGEISAFAETYEGEQKKRESSALSRFNKMEGTPEQKFPAFINKYIESVKDILKREREKGLGSYDTEFTGEYQIREDETGAIDKINEYIDRINSVAEEYGFIKLNKIPTNVGNEATEHYLELLSVYSNNPKDIDAIKDFVINSRNFDSITEEEDFKSQTDISGQIDYINERIEQANRDMSFVSDLQFKKIHKQKSNLKSETIIKKLKESLSNPIKKKTEVKEKSKEDYIAEYISEGYSAEDANNIYEWRKANGTLDRKMLMPNSGFMFDDMSDNEYWYKEERKRFEQSWDILFAGGVKVVNQEAIDKILAYNKPVAVTQKNIDILKQWIGGVDIEVIQPDNKDRATNGGAFGWYDLAKKKAYVVEGAPISVVLHEVGWHATLDWAKAHDKTMYEKMLQVASEAPADIKLKVLNLYGELREEVFLDEVGAELFTRHAQKKLYQYLTTQDARKWWQKLFDAFESVFKKARVKIFRQPIKSKKIDFDGMKDMSSADFLNTISDTMIKGEVLGKWVFENDDDFGIRMMQAGEAYGYTPEKKEIKAQAINIGTYNGNNSDVRYMRSSNGSIYGVNTGTEMFVNIRPDQKIGECADLWLEQLRQSNPQAYKLVFGEGENPNIMSDLMTIVREKLKGLVDADEIDIPDEVLRETTFEEFMTFVDKLDNLSMQEVSRSITRVQTDMEKYDAMISLEEPTSKSFKTAIERWWTAAMDDGLPIRRMLEGLNAHRIKNGKSKLDSRYDIENLRNLSPSKAKSFIEDFRDRGEFYELAEQVNKLNDIIHGKPEMKELADRLALDRVNGYKEAINSLVEVYMLAKDNVERRNLDLPNTSNDAWIEATGMADVEFVEAFEAVFTTEQLTDFWRAKNKATNVSLDFMLDYGVLSQKKYDEFKQRQYYVPQRGFDNLELEERLSIGEKRNTPNPKSVQALYKASGRDTMATSPMAQILYITDNAIRTSLNNEYRKAMLDLVRENPEYFVKEGKTVDIENGWQEITFDEDGNEKINFVSERDGELLKEDEETRNNISVMEEKKKELEQKIKAEGKKETPDVSLINSIKKEIENLDKGIIKAKDSIHYKWLKGDVSEHHVFIKENGKDIALKFEDKRIANALNNLHFDQAGAVKWIKKANRYCSNIYTTYNPTFGFKNLARDAMQIFMNGTARYGYSFLSLYSKNILSCLPKGFMNIASYINKSNVTFDEKFDEFLHSGAMTGYVFSQSLDEYREDVKSLLQGDYYENGGLSKKGWEKFKGALKFITEFSELYVRYTTFRTARELGMSQHQSAVMAKNLGVNFDKRGSGFGDGSGYKAGEIKRNDHSRLFQMIDVINNNMSFSRASMRGMASLYEPLFFGDKKTRKNTGIMLGGIAIFGVVEGLAYMLSGDDDDYRDRLIREKVSAWDRHSNTMWWVDDTTWYGKIAKNVGAITQNFIPAYTTGFELARLFYNTCFNEYYKMDLGNAALNFGYNVLTEVMNYSIPLPPTIPEFATATVAATVTWDENKLRQLAPVITPTFAKPIMELAFNVDYLGNKVYYPLRPEKVNSEYSNFNYSFLWEDEYGRHNRWVLEDGDLKERYNHEYNVTILNHFLDSYLPKPIKSTIDKVMDKYSEANGVIIEKPANKDAKYDTQVRKASYRYARDLVKNFEDIVKDHIDATKNVDIDTDTCKSELIKLYNSDIADIYIDAKMAVRRYESRDVEMIKRKYFSKNANRVTDEELKNEIGFDAELMRKNQDSVVDDCKNIYMQLLQYSSNYDKLARKAKRNSRVQ